MALPTGNYIAFKVDLVLSDAEGKKEIQKGNNICSHRQTPHLLLLQKHFNGPLPEGTLPICTPVTLSTVQPTASVTYSHRSASHWLRPSTNTNYSLYLINNTPHPIRSHIWFMFYIGWKKHLDSTNSKIQVVHRLLSLVQSSPSDTSIQIKVGEVYRCLHWGTQEHHWRSEQYTLQHRQETE